MRVVLYARVSSDKQDLDLSISAQLRAQRDYARTKDHEVVREFVDEAESGRTSQRPVFQEMIALARRKPPPFQAILVWKLSRFARNREDSIIYKSLLRRQGVQVISVTEHMEDSPTGRMLEGMIEVMDEFYSANLAQEVARGMRESASRGFWVSSGTPYGYRRVHVQDGGKLRAKLEPDHQTEGVVQKMFQMASDGMGCKEIAKALNLQGIPSPRGKRWGKGRVHKVITNELYTGTLLWGVSGNYHRQAGLKPVRVEDAYPALVDRSTFEGVIVTLKSRAPTQTPPRRVSSPYLLSGLLRCGSCHATMFGTGAKSGRFHYYVCATAYRSGRQACSGKSVPQSLIEREVLKKVQQLILREEHLGELVRLTNKELEGSLDQAKELIDNLESQVGDTDTRLGRLYDALETGKVELDDLAPRVRELREKRDHLQRAKAEAEETIAAGQVELVDQKMVLGYLKDLNGVLNTASLGEQRTFLRSFIQSVERYDSQVTMRYTLPLPPEKVLTDPLGVLDFVPSGGAEGTRTPDFLRAREALSQLSYSPMIRPF